MASNLTDGERERVLKLCTQYLSGAWKTAGADKIGVARLSGGLTNILYRCVLDDSVVMTGGDSEEPRQILLRIYGRTPSDIKTQLRIFNQLAHIKMGPKLYCSFPEGRFEEYLPSSPLTLQEMTDEHISNAIAKKFAVIHKLDVGYLNNHSDKGWLHSKFHEYNDFIEQNRANPIKFNDNVPQPTRKMAYEMMAIDFKKEIAFLESLINKSTEPVVFSHNDLHHNNILLLHDARLDLDDRIVLIDFEAFSLNYRSFDLANHLSEWCFNYTGDKYPYFDASVDRFPSEERQRAFITQYLIESEKSQNGHLTADQPRMSLDNSNSTSKVEEVYQEVQSFFLASNFLWSIWAIVFAHTSPIDFGYWEMAKHKWDVYEFVKAKYLKNNSMNNSYNNGDTDKNQNGLQAAKM